MLIQTKKNDLLEETIEYEGLVVLDSLSLSMRKLLSEH
ncbi:MAG: Unknown protein [uncultured Sulfurovum sp.]|uniref:Uncharacterized protein n=1 Tax=uncultured Sulfurovum sp. TaxID=269237 RepID=A0A6S6SY64_9BACT|nr:MAG: Unknown protein [uncultured Sulfurovum sp.]